MGAPAAFPEANVILGPPPGSEAEVSDLQVLRADGRLVSCWQLSPEEIAEIVRTGKIWLSVWGAVTQPPVLVTAHKSEVI